MSRFLTENKDGTYLEEIESMEVCRWRINDVYCFDKSPDLGDYPYPREKCESKEGCRCFEKENGIIGSD